MRVAQVSQPNYRSHTQASAPTVPRLTLTSRGLVPYFPR
jgi:hypothetical protein